MPLAPAFPLLTARLRLRPFEARDAAAFHAMRADPVHTRYVPYSAMSHEEIARVIALRQTWLSLGEEGSGIVLAVERRDTGAFIGEVLLFRYQPGLRTAEHGYALATEHAGQGYATEAARALLHWGFTEGGLHRAVAKLDARNASSARVLEKLGFRKEAHHVRDYLMDGEWTDTAVYAQLAGEWGRAQHP